MQMGITIYCLLALAGLAVLSILLPVKIYLKSAGGTDSGFEVTGRVMIYSGLVGGGMYYFDKAYRANIFLHTWKILDADITSIVSYFRSKAKKRAAEKPEKEKIKKEEEKKPLFERMKSGYSKIDTYMGYFKEGYRDFREIVHFDYFNADITMGLGNPAITGLTSGIIFALNGVLPKSCEIIHSFDFSRRVIQGDVSIKITFISLKFWKNVLRHLPDIIRKYVIRK